MIVIVDNGKGSEQISTYIREKTIIVDPKKSSSYDANAYILTDGDIKQKNANIKLIKSSSVPILGIGAGSLFIANVFGSKITEYKGKKKKRITLKKACPLTLNMKKFFVVSTECTHALADIPDNFGIVASSPDYEYEIFQEFEKPLFGVHFSSHSPELITIIKNFSKFLSVWEKYHK